MKDPHVQNSGPGFPALWNAGWSNSTGPARSVPIWNVGAFHADTLDRWAIQAGKIRSRHVALERPVRHGLEGEGDGIESDDRH